MGTPPYIQLNRIAGQQLITAYANTGAIRLQQGVQIFGQPSQSSGVLHGAIVNQAGQVIAQADVAFSRNGAVLILRDKPPMVNTPGTTAEAGAQTSPEVAVFSPSDFSSSQAVFHSQSPLTETAMFSGMQMVLHSDVPEGAPVRNFEQAARPQPAAPERAGGNIFQGTPAAPETLRSPSLPTAQPRFETSVAADTRPTPVLSDSLQAVVREVTHEIVANLQILLPELQSHENLPQLIRTFSEQVAVRLEEAVRFSQTGEAGQDARSIASALRSTVASSLLVFAKDVQSARPSSTTATNSAQSFLRAETPLGDARFAPGFAQVLQDRLTQSSLPGRLAAIFSGIPSEQPQTAGRDGLRSFVPVQTQNEAKPDQLLRRDVPVQVLPYTTHPETEKPVVIRTLGTEGYETAIEHEDEALAPTIRVEARSEDSSRGSQGEERQQDDQALWTGVEKVLQSEGFLTGRTLRPLSFKDGLNLTKILKGYANPQGLDLLDVLAVMGPRIDWSEGASPNNAALKRLAGYRKRKGWTKGDAIRSPIEDILVAGQMSEEGGGNELQPHGNI